MEKGRGENGIDSLLVFQSNSGAVNFISVSLSLSLLLSSFLPRSLHRQA